MVKKIISPNYQKAQDTAYRLLKGYSLLADTVFPVDPILFIKQTKNLALDTYSRIATCVNCSVDDIRRITGSDDGTSFFDVKKEKYIIAYNDTVQTESRKRFTIAHELGHIYLGHLLGNDISDDIYNLQEKEANYFAKRFLVPLPFFTRLLEKTTLESLSVSDISFIFNVSFDVAKYSINNYNKLPFSPRDDRFCEPYNTELDRRLSIIQMAHRMATTA